MKKFLIASLTLSLLRNITLGQDAPPTSATASASPAGTEETERVVVQSQEMDITRESIVPSLGATRYTVGPDRLDSQAEGENAPFNQTLLRFPGVAQDSFGQLHVRGEHANLQYRIDDVLLPESIPGFGQVLETRFADNISLITGALPAQFGFRNTGVIDIHTKSGAVFQQGDASVYGGSFDTIMPSFEYGGVSGKLNYYWTGSYLHDGIGIENPTGSANPLHDDTDQYRMFG
ncbi:MAG: TonB-dependent receptor, partial [Verrucomicrobia bacterium]